MGPRSIVVLDRVDAGADEFRVGARRQSEVQPGGCRAGQRRHTRGPARVRPRGAENPYLRRDGDHGPRGLPACDRRLDRECYATAGEGPRAGPSRRRHAGVPVRMSITRRQFFKGGIAAFTITYAAPELISDLALAQGSSSRNLVVLYLSGGNDSLSMLVP